MWTDQVWASPLDIRRRVFCNRSLNMRKITTVGFDMDYTLAQVGGKGGRVCSRVLGLRVVSSVRVGGAA